MREPLTRLPWALKQKLEIAALIKFAVEHATRA